jgi:dTDP-4-amino-4,6-dideoxygalactose transaminase
MEMKYKINLSDISYDNAEIRAIEKVLKSGWLSQGRLTAKFEDAFSKLIGINFSLAVSNCTTALHLALLASGISKGDEVIVPSLTFVATANSVIYTGATPVFADIESLLRPVISPEDVESKITEKTKGVIAVHFAGYPAEMNELRKICRRYKLKLIEDSAHAINVKYGDRKLGGIGDAGCFSFFANKNITTGEGGMLATNDENIYNKAKLMRSHSVTSSTYERHKIKFTEYDAVDLGFNYRITEITAALGLAQLEKLSKIKSVRKKLVDVYKKELADVENIIIPFSNFTGDSGYHIFPILVRKTKDRLKLIEHLNRSGIQISHHYKPIHLFSFYRRSFGTKRGDLPLTEEFSAKEITLPLHQNLSVKDVKYVCNKVKEGLVKK